MVIITVAPFIASISITRAELTRAFGERVIRELDYDAQHHPQAIMNRWGANMHLTNIINTNYFFNIAGHHASEAEETVNHIINRLTMECTAT